MEQARWLQAGSLLYRSVRVRALSAALQQEAERKSWILEQAWDCRSYQKNSNEAHVHNQMCEEQLRFAFWVWAASQLGLFLVLRYFIGGNDDAQNTSALPLICFFTITMITFFKLPRDKKKQKNI